MILFQRRSAHRLVTFFTLSAAFGCSAQSFSRNESAAHEASALRALLPTEIVGTLAAGETKTIAYSNPPEYRALTINARANEPLDVWVRSFDGNPRAWLLGSQYETLAYNYDASTTDKNAHITFTAPAAGTYYLAFRDEAYEDASFTVSMANKIAGCVGDLECGGADVCMLGRCMTVSNETRSLGAALRGPVHAAYDPSDTLHVAYQYLNAPSASGSGYRTFVTEGPWTGPLTPIGGFWSDRQFDLWRRAGSAPVLSLTAPAPTSSGGEYVYFDGLAALATSPATTVMRYVTARSESGSDFVAAALSRRTSSNSVCDLQFISRTAGGAWSNPISLGECAWVESLALHVREGGATADVIAAGRGGPGIVVYGRAPIGSRWTRISLVPTAITDGSQVIRVQARDGTSLLVLSTYTFNTNTSYPDYTSRYALLSDNAIEREIPLGTYPVQIAPPFRSMDADSTGTAYVLKAQRTSASYTPEIVRVTPDGVVTSQSLGSVVTGSAPSDALAISSRGEIALLHTGAYQQISLRRFTPR